MGAGRGPDGWALNPSDSPVVNQLLDGEQLEERLDVGSLLQGSQEELMEAGELGGGTSPGRRTTRPWDRLEVRLEEGQCQG